MLYVIGGHPIWKHISLHGLVITVQENEPLHVGQQNIILHTFYLHRIIIAESVVI
jgi:hypothetical protein